jgi:hypothetical protein
LPSDAVIGQDVNVAAVSADGLSVDGDVNCAGLVTQGAVSMDALQITGSLDLTGAQVHGRGPRTLSVGNASVRGRIIGRGLQVEGETLVHDTSVTRVELNGAQLRNPDGLALSAGGLSVSGGMFCRSGFTAHGGVWLVGTRLGANLSFAKSTLMNPGKVALKLNRATLEVRVASDLNFERARIDGCGQSAIVADGAMIDGSLKLAEISAIGEVAIRTGHIGRRVMLTGARLENQAGTALKVSGTESLPMCSAETPSSSAKSGWQALRSMVILILTAPGSSSPGATPWALSLCGRGSSRSGQPSPSWGPWICVMPRLASFAMTLPAGPATLTWTA